MSIVRTDFYVEHGSREHWAVFDDSDPFTQRRHLHVMHGCEQLTSATPDELCRWHRTDHDDTVRA